MVRFKVGTVRFRFNRGTMCCLILGYARYSAGLDCFLALLQRQNICIGYVDAAWVFDADYFEHNLGIRILVQERSQAFGMHVVAPVEDHKSPLNAPIKSPWLLLQDSQAKALIVKARSREEGTCNGSSFAHG
jgi:hypothetical protein